MRDHSAPTYPLSREAFRHAIQVGHGRAQLHVRKCGAHAVRQEILDAATTCRTYDPQAEGFPSAWLAELCVAADLVQQFIAQGPVGNDRDRKLRADLLKEFALAGYPSAKRALYDECELAEQTIDLLGEEQIIELDGEPGLAFIARVLGKLLTERPDFWVNDEPLRSFDYIHGEGRAAAVLEGLSSTDALIAAYLEGLASGELQRSEFQLAHTPPPDEIVPIIRDAQNVLYPARTWGRNAELDQLEAVLHLAITATSPLTTENALRYLGGSLNPPVAPQLFTLLRHKSSTIRRLAAQVLGQHASPESRSAGIALLSFDLDVALVLLRKSAQSEDGTKLRQALEPRSDIDQQHSVVFGLTQLFQNNQHVAEPLLGLYVYEYSPCMKCRGEAVKYLFRCNACPEWLRDEGRHDASEGIRTLCTKSD